MQDVFYLETWVIFTVVKIEMDTKLPQTLSMFVPEAIVNDFLYTLFVMTCLSCAAFIMHRHNIPVPEGTWAP